MDTVVEAPVTGTLDIDALATVSFVGFNLHGSLPPLVMVRTWSSEVPLYQRLARELGPEQPIYTIGHPCGTSDSDYPWTVDDWRDLCLDRLRSLTPPGPLWLGGWSFGGVIALEMARTLMREGREVAQIVMLDTRAPKAKAKGRLYDLQQAAVAVQEYTLFEDRAERAAYLRRRLARVGTRLRKYATSTAIRLRGKPAPRPTMPSGRPMTPLNRAIHVCYLKYRQQPIDIPVIQLWTQESRGQMSGDATLGWSRSIDGDLMTANTPGTHMTMFDETHIHELATTLGIALRRARVDAPAVTAANPPSSN